MFGTITKKFVHLGSSVAPDESEEITEFARETGLEFDYSSNYTMLLGHRYGEDLFDLENPLLIVKRGRTRGHDKGYDGVPDFFMGIAFSEAAQNKFEQQLNVLDSPIKMAAVDFKKAMHDQTEELDSNVTRVSKKMKRSDIIRNILFVPAPFIPKMQITAPTRQVA